MFSLLISLDINQGPPLVACSNLLVFDLILRYGAFSPAKFIYKGFTRGNACILTESVYIGFLVKILIWQESHEIVPFVSLRTLDVILNL